MLLWFSHPLFVPSPIMVAMALGNVPARAGIMLCLALAAGSYLLLLPLDYLWYQAFGKV